MALALDERVSIAKLVRINAEIPERYRSRTLRLYVLETGISALSKVQVERDSENDFRYSPGDAFLKFIQPFLDRAKTIVWVDLGGGNGIAQREAKATLDRAGINPSRLKTYCIDVQSMNLNSTGLHERISEAQFSEEIILAKKYEPIFIIGDAQYVEFPEKADLVTGVHLLQHLDNPLRSLTNSLSQAKVGGIVSLGCSEGVKYYENPTASYATSTLKKELCKTGSLANFGFEFIDTPYDMHARWLIRKARDECLRNLLDSLVLFKREGRENKGYSLHGYTRV